MQSGVFMLASLVQIERSVMVCYFYFLGFIQVVHRIGGSIGTDGKKTPIGF